MASKTYLTLLEMASDPYVCFRVRIEVFIMQKTSRGKVQNYEERIEGDLIDVAAVSYAQETFFVLVLVSRGKRVGCMAV